MGRLRTLTGRQRRESPAPWTAPLLTSRRHLDLLRMCGATGRRG
ncbi:hypothetical protein ACWDFR_04225 [Streptomyces sp. 900105755]|jgi:hypothetical protein|uniref:Uncharacterized protein n=1 Tax=Streptomyces sp. 900105755 TaxID=3154389 RepID=A0ABV1TA97_9ACTN